MAEREMIWRLITLSLKSGRPTRCGMAENIGACGYGMQDGTIEWNYSTGGHWTRDIGDGASKRFEVWKDCELGQTYKEKTFDTRHGASEWVRENERVFPGWHLRVVEA